MLIVPAADVRPDAAFEQPRTHLQQLDAEEDKDDTAGSYAELMAELAQKVHSTPPSPALAQHSPSTPAPRCPKPRPFDYRFAWTLRGSRVHRSRSAEVYGFEARPAQPSPPFVLTPPHVLRLSSLRLITSPRRSSTRCSRWASTRRSWRSSSVTRITSARVWVNSSRTRWSFTGARRIRRGASRSCPP